MGTISLGYGRSNLPFDYNDDDFDILGRVEDIGSLSDIEIDRLLDQPIDAPPIEEAVSPGESVLMVVPDATRQTASGRIVNLLVRRLIAQGVAPFNIRIIFATGIHRPVTKE